jgi:hypothetical protein
MPAATFRAAPRNSMPVISPNAPLVYSQSRGTLTQNGKVLARGYAGHGAGLNNPGLQGLRNVGPIPTGRYTIGKFTTFRNMPYSMPLTRVGPQPAGPSRGGFWIHAGRKDGAPTASRGCIVVPPAEVRAGIAFSGARTLIVIR